MPDLGNAKLMGGIGAILMLIGFIPVAGPLISIVGLVLIFVAVKYITDITKDKTIFDNYLYHFIFSIIAIVAIIAIMIIAFFAIGGFTWITTLEGAQITDFASFMDYFAPILGGVVLALIIGWIFYILSAIYLRKSYTSIAQHTGVDLFKTTGTIYFIGAITTIILIGFLILFIARILEIVSYFTLPDKLPAQKKTE